MSAIERRQLWPVAGGPDRPFFTPATLFEVELVDGVVTAILIDGLYVAEEAGVYHHASDASG